MPKEILCDRAYVRYFFYILFALLILLGCLLTCWTNRYSEHIYIEIGSIYVALGVVLESFAVYQFKIHMANKNNTTKN